MGRRSCAPQDPTPSTRTAPKPASAQAKLFGSFGLPGCTSSASTSTSKRRPSEQAVCRTDESAQSANHQSGATRRAAHVLGASCKTVAALPSAATDEINTIVAQLDKEEMAKKRITKGKKRGKKKAGEKKKELRRRRADRALHAAIAASTAAMTVARHAATTATAAAATASTAPVMAASTAAVVVAKVAAHDAA